MQNLLENLNPEQLAAVTLPAQSALILAGAGSGKTKVLTTRIAWLITTGQISPQGVLAVTFTNKAAKEMLARLGGMLPINVRGMWIGTFHGLCNRLLRAHHQDAGLPATFQILDSQDQLASIKRLMKAHGIDDDKYPPRNVMYFINGSKDQGLRAADVDVSDDYNRRLAELYALYEAQCQRDGVVDFGELLLRSYELLTRSQPLREHYQQRFRHILVDEFQDTNDLQYNWLKLLAGQRGAVFAVGDDDQSIYAFRGANVGNMMAFEREFKVQNMIKLEQNYRSHGHILDSANILIGHNSKRLGKDLRTDAGHGEQVRVYESTSDLQEAQWIIEETKNLIAEGMLRSDIAVLYRSNAQSRVIEHALFSAGIAYRVYGGQRFFERAEIKHAIAYLQLIDNPHNDSAFARVVNFPTRGIGARALEQLQDAARQFNISMFAAVAYVTGKAGSSLGAFARMIDTLSQESMALPLPEVVRVMLDVSGLKAHYKTEREGADRIENLDQLIDSASLFVAEEGFGHNAPSRLGPQADVPRADLRVLQPELAGSGEPAQADIIDADAPLNLVMSPLSAFLSHASLEAGDNQAQAGQDALQLMTVHSAKGLEFDAVFITGLEEGLFPHENSVNEDGGIEEERRLMYVAITRARKRLYISFSQTRMLHGQTRYNVRSRFLDELPEDSVKWLAPRVQSAHWFASPKAAWAVAAAEPVPTTMRQNAIKDIGWRIGESVMHQKFGEGVIVNIEVGGGSPRAQINFGRQGVKLLDLGIAKLERV